MYIQENADMWGEDRTVEQDELGFDTVQEETVMKEEEKKMQ